jgi:hypothetical protein
MASTTSLLSQETTRIPLEVRDFKQAVSRDPFKSSSNGRPADFELAPDCLLGQATTQT